MAGTALEINSTEPSGVSRRNEKVTDYREIGSPAMLSAALTTPSLTLLMCNVVTNCDVSHPNMADKWSSRRYRGLAARSLALSGRGE
jgi:hypothetical protein